MSSLGLTFQQVTPLWLSEKLSQSGALVGGNVTGIEPIAVTKTRVAQLQRFRVHYSADSRQRGPEALIFKVPRPEVLPTTRREVDVYTQVAPAMREPPLVRCYDAAFDSTPGTYHVLLEDMSETHAVNRPGMPPTLGQAKQIVDVLARFHAFWWDHPKLGATIGRRPTEYDVRRTIGHAQCYFGQLADQLGDRLPESGKQAFEVCFREHARSLSSRLARGKVTLVHGDAHALNFLLPFDGASNHASTYILDWNSAPWVWECSFGVGDVAYMMVRYWPAQRRRMLERELFERYHTGLLAGGVADYSPEDLWDDYRQACLLNLYMVIEESMRTEPAHWYPQLMNVLSAVEDHRCLDVLRT